MPRARARISAVCGDNAFLNHGISSITQHLYHPTTTTKDLKLIAIRSLRKKYGSAFNLARTRPSRDQKGLGTYGELGDISWKHGGYDRSILVITNERCVTMKASEDKGSFQVGISNFIVSDSSYVYIEGTTPTRGHRKVSPHKHRRSLRAKIRLPSDNSAVSTDRPLKWPEVSFDVPFLSRISPCPKFVLCHTNDQLRLRIYHLLVAIG